MKKTDNYLECRHCIGPNCTDYIMACDVLKETKKGKMKIRVYGERNWKNKDHISRIRYVDKSRVKNRTTFKWKKYKITEIK